MTNSIHKIPSFDPHFIEDTFGEFGSLASVLPNFIPRNQQKNLAQEICKSFEDESILLAEAGAGVGKTFAYLLPAARWALSHNERFIVSTHTLTLQQQLYKKDLPILRKIFGPQLKYSILVGQKNYLCLLRLEQKKENYLNRPVEETRDLDRKIISHFASKLKSQSYDGILPKQSEKKSQNFRDTLGVDGFSCLKKNCSFYSNCFYFRAIKETRESHILVVNHSLFLLDRLKNLENTSRTTSRGFENPDKLALFGDYHRVIVDEAHHLEGVSLKMIGDKLDEHTHIKIFNDLLNPRRDAKFDLFTGLKKQALRLPEGTLTKPQSASLNLFFKTFPHSHARAFHAASVFWVGLSEYLVNSSPGKHIIELQRVKDDEILLALQGLAKNTIDDSYYLYDSAKKYLSTFQEFLLTYKHDEALLRLNSMFETALEKIKKLCATLETCFLRLEDTSIIRWCASTGGQGSARSEVCTLPVDSSEMLSKLILAPSKSVVFTSATLSAKRDFGFYRKQIGTHYTEKIVHEIQEKSPFDFETVLKIVVVKGCYFENRQENFEAMTETIKDGIMASRGGCLVLFTSFETMMTVYRSVKVHLDGYKLPLYCQGQRSNGDLLARFRRIKNSTLFATDSFWEGVDVTGQSLRHLIIARLPFKQPGDPIFEAKEESIRKKGGNSFLELQVPAAQIKFKQGIGRLIRTQTDRGVLTLLDDRIVTKGYGNSFIQCLPTGRIDSVVAKDQVYDTISHYFSKILAKS